MTRPVGITETILRDGHQSLLATRMKTKDMLPVIEAMDEVGYHSLEAWGGATYDACLRYLDEDPWERLVTLKKACKKTPLQMLLRGQNLLGYQHYSDSVVRQFVQRSVENGIDIIRIFDALNDVENLRVAIEATRGAGGHAQACVVYTTSPIHTEDHYIKTAKALAEMGAQSICIKDMAGLMTPLAGASLVRSLKEQVGLSVQVHAHYTSGLAGMTYLKAIEAGADVVDCCLSPLAMGTSQPATESMVAALAGGQYDTGIQMDDLIPLTNHFKKVRNQYSELLSGGVSVDPEVFTSQIPGGMLSNLRAQLKQQGMLDRYDEVVAEVPRIRQELGYPPLVTPMSQIVGTQAVLNVAMGERYKLNSKQIKDYVKGLYGQPPQPLDPEFVEKIIGSEAPITGRPADLLPDQWAEAKAKYGKRPPEDLLTAIIFPDLYKG